MDIFSNDWREAVTATPITNLTEGGSVLLFFSVEGGTPLEVRAQPYFGEQNWVQPSICIFSGGINGRLIETVVQGSFANELGGRFGMARSGGFAREIDVFPGERMLCVVARVLASSSMKVFRRYPTVTATVLQTYR